jgi:hypothetical protein
MSLQRVPIVVVGISERPSSEMDTGWRGLIEQAARSWPVTLRLALLSLVVAGCAALVASTIGVAGQVALAAAGLRTRWRRGDPSVTERTTPEA